MPPGAPVGIASAVLVQAEDSERDTDLMLACVRAYNDWLTEWCAADSRRLLPITATPFWDVDACVAEVERCAALGHRGVLFTGEPQHFGLPYLGDRHWDRFYAAVQDAGLPISFHSFGSFSFTSCGTGSFAAASAT